MALALLWLTPRAFLLLLLFPLTIAALGCTQHGDDPGDGHHDDHRHGDGGGNGKLRVAFFIFSVCWDLGLMMSFIICSHYVLPVWIMDIVQKSKMCVVLLFRGWRVSVRPNLTADCMGGHIAFGGFPPYQVPLTFPLD